jgi:preprotein translocase subunit YajC
MGKFFGNVDDQSIETMHIMGNGWIYAFFIIGAILLVAGWLVRWQVKRMQGMMARLKAEDEAVTGGGKSDSAPGESPRG